MVPFFFSSTPVKVAGDERTIIAIVAPHGSVPLCLGVPVLRSLGEGGYVANRPCFKNTKITKRTQFKKLHHPPSPSAAKDNLSKFINYL